MFTGRLLPAFAISTCFVACGARSELGTATAAPSDGGVACAPSTATVLATNPASVGFAGAPHVAGGFVYWLQLADGPADSWNSGKLERIGTVYRVAANGGAVQSLVSFGIRSDRVTTPLVGFDDTSMYWAADPIGKGPGEADGAIMRANLDGTNVTTIVGGLTHPAGVAVANAKVFFVVVDKLERANVDGSDVEVLDASGELGLFNAGSFAVSTDYLYKSALGVARAPVTGGPFSLLITVPWDGGLIGSPMIGGLSVHAATGLALTSTVPDPSEPPAPGTLLRWSTSGGAFVPLTTGFAFAKPPGGYDGAWWCTASDGTMAYFDTHDAILRVPLTGGTPQTVGPTVQTGGIDFDAQHVYWTSLNENILSVYSFCK